MKTTKITQGSLIAELSLPEKVALGEAIPLSISIQNANERPLIILDTGYLPECHIVARNLATGGIAKEKKFGQSAIGGDPEKGRSQLGRISLNKGQAKTWKPIDLNSCFIFQHGKYALSISLRVNTDDSDKKSDVVLDGIVIQID